MVHVNNDYQSWHGHFTTLTNLETLTLRDGHLYLYRGGSESPVLVGTVKGHNLGAGGLYVANLDGNEEGLLSVAFYDPDFNAWSWGTFTGSTLNWKPAGETVNGKTVFHVGNGASFYPIDQVSQNGVASDSPMDIEGIPPTADASNLPAPFIYPLLGSQYDALAPSQHVWTTFYLTADGNITAATRAKEDTLLAGFHAHASIGLYAPGNFDVPLCYADPKKDIGVTGTLFGHSDVTFQWTYQCPTNVLPLLKYYAVIQKWSPDWYAMANDAKKIAEAVAAIIKPLKSLATGN